MAGLALEGIRVIDCSISWATPLATSILGDMGAEVIKVESIQRLDVWRTASPLRVNEDGWWERSPNWNTVNRNKLGITLDLTSSRGAELFKRLIKIGDLVMENYTPRVMANFGLDYPILKEVNPTIVMISMPGWGMTGPWRDYTGFAPSVEQMSGMPQLVGYLDGSPLMHGLGLALADPVAGLYGAFAAAIALKQRRRTGHGQYLDLAQNEALSCIIGDAIMDFTLNKRVQGRRGNRHPFMAPHGCYRCAGQDNYIAIAISSDKQWASFVQAIGGPAWCKDDRFTNSMGRLANQDELDKLIEEWTIGHGDCEVMHLLQRAGVAAAPVLSPPAMLEEPNLKERGFWEWIDRAEIGPGPYPGILPRMSKTPGTLRLPAPTLGQHNDYVLGELLGLTREEIAALAEEQVIGTRPLL